MSWKSSLLLLLASCTVIEPISGRIDGVDGDEVTGRMIRDRRSGITMVELHLGDGRATCRGEAQPMDLRSFVIIPYIASWPRCHGAHGRMVLTCSDGTRISGTWDATGCYAGRGQATDSNGRPLYFVFGAGAVSREP